MAENQVHTSHVTPSQEAEDLARQVALEMAEEPEDVGDFVSAQLVGENLYDYRFASHITGYEGWQWSVTVYHDQDADRWTVDESSLIPTGESLLAPEWIPWKDRILPEDLSPTDVLGTAEDDSRLEEGVTDISAETRPLHTDRPANEPECDLNPEHSPQQDREQQTSSDSESTSITSREDVLDAVDTFRLSCRHVMTAQAKGETAKRWHNGPHGPKSMSTQTAGGNVCQSCAFFIPLQGQLGTMFGVCANKWSQDDGRVVSLDHGCGSHSEIEPPDPTPLWVQSEPRVDDDVDSIEIIPQTQRDENSQVELIEESSQTPEEESDEITTEAALESAEPDELMNDSKRA